jgi:SET domain-containing protein
MKKANNKKLSSFAKKLLKDLEENVYCRLSPSTVHGVGVFAIRDIPKGKELFKTFLDYQLTPVPLEMVMKNPKIDPAVRTLAYDMCPVLDGKLNLYRAGMNAIDISFFLNHSTRPNVATKPDSGSFFAARRIRKGEELFSNHSTYSEGPII